MNNTTSEINPSMNGFCEKQIDELTNEIIGLQRSAERSKREKQSIKEENKLLRKQIEDLRNNEVVREMYIQELKGKLKEDISEGTPPVFQSDGTTGVF